jgi:phage/plasmid-associated DNA primase
VVLLSNELVDFGTDVSGAMSNRVIPIECRESFLGREDVDLFERDLLPELPGILNSAIQGWRFLQSAGRFALDDDAQDLVHDLEGIHSGNFGEFVGAVLVKDPDGTAWPGSLTDKDALFIEYRKWCEENKRSAKNKDHFYRDVKAAGIDANFRWDPVTRKSRDKDGNRPTPRVRGYSINRNYTTEGAEGN